MNGVNLHQVVRAAITAIKPDETVILYQALGQENVEGIATPIYAKGKEVRAQFQPLGENRLNHLETTSDTIPTQQVFLYSQPDLPVAGISRQPFARGGDFLLRDGVYLLVTSVVEDWSKVGWVNAEVTTQITPPDFSGSPWFVKGGEQDAD